MNLAAALLLARAAFAANRLRVALTLVCIALGVALAGAVHTIHASALAEIDRAARTLAGSADIEIRGPRNGFDDRVFLDVAASRAVQVASPVVEVEAPMAGREESLRFIGIDPFRATRLQPAFVARSTPVGMGRTGSLLDPRNAWLTPVAAARLGLAEGSTFRVLVGSTEVEWSVAGFVDGLNDAGSIAIVDIAAAQSRLGRVGRLSRIDVRLRPGVDGNAARKALAGVLPAGVVVAPPASLSERAATVTRAYRVNLDALALIALATGGFLVFSTLALQAARRRQEFALLRAMGVTRRGLFAALALEAAVVGGIGAVAGTFLGLAGARALLRGFGADLGAGFFAAESDRFAPDAAALALIALAGVATAVAGALWVARAVARIDVAQALRDRALDLPRASGHAGGLALLLAVAGIPLLFVPPIGGLPLAGYAAIAAWLAAGVLAIEPLCRHVLARRRELPDPVATLALAQVRELPGHLAASVAGIVLSASLAIAMAIMVHSFRVSLEDWLRGVVGADLYMRSGQGGDTGYFTREEEERVRALPEVARLEALRYDRLAMDASGPPLSLVARPIDARILAGFRTTPDPLAASSPMPGVWVSEAATDLYRWRAGDRLTLPIGGKPVEVRVVGVIRDYARTWGAVLMPIEAYRALTGDTRTNDFAIHLAPGIDAEAGMQAIRRALPEAKGLAIEESGEVLRRSLEIFDRSFAVTYAFEAVAIAIALGGVTSSFAALAWARRREFGMLRFLGLRRGEILRLLAIEGIATGAIGSLLGLVSGIAISLVLIHVVNRQSFHWTLEVHWPWVAIAALLAALVALCAIGARASGAMAVRREAILAVKDDA